MSKNTPDSESELANWRRQIDDIDDRLIALLIERMGIVGRVGEMKRRAAPGRYPLRPGREAEMVRRIIGKFAQTPFFAAASSIWRIIISASTANESPLKLSVFAPERESDLYWLAREYFGSFTPIVRQPHVKRVIGDLLDGKAAVGIVPMLRGSDTTYWWTNLMEQGSDIPKIFACIPFVHAHTPAHNAPSALAIGRIAPEPSGDDVSLLVIEALHNVSQNRMQMAFASARLDANWINVATLSPSTRHHLVEIRGFITDDHVGMQALRAALGDALIGTSFLGAYAAPVILNANHETKRGLHAAGSSSA